ncbi:MAG: AAA family ATPase [Patescibacteria group bacterium]|nr:AAA family ATPase [Patescibacteria group bacterium]MCL5431795.1 AAA family ATPase [Patescibacteria group bacterium]
MDTPAIDEIRQLEDKVVQAKLPEELSQKVKAMVVRLDRMAKLGGNYAAEFDATTRYLDWVTALPWDKKSDDILDIPNAETVLNKNHYGLKEAKDKILEYLAVLKLSKAGNRAPILLLVGLVGTGKTTLAYSVAQAMGRKFERIPFGGIGDAQFLRGQSRSFADAEPGAIIKALRRAGTKNPVILLDEIDRVAEEARATIMGVLVELLDPEQNSRFADHYIDYPFDLSDVLFIATSNNTTNISTAVLDRLEPIQMPSYTDEEKITIGRDFVLPKVLKDSGLPEGTLQISADVWPKIVRPLGFDSGIRTLERTINNMVRKAALSVVSGKGQQIIIDDTNLQQFLV